ncbi:hypothetical protein [Paenibacillus terrigena]|uniref:hypothetical protein n=1 Tax=Paenibacillus terrigena TaxID=369333 RepID=UPI0028D2F384|nr:hypothetical protein [Paenibacillus terrigena]
MLVNGTVGVIVAPRGKMLFFVLKLKIVDGKIAKIEMIAEYMGFRWNNKPNWW